MPDINITIPAPTLTTGQTFKVRYKQLPSGIWSAYSTRSNLPFTISGLNEGNYQFEFILVNADATECTAVYRNYTVVAEFSCISFNSELIEDNGLYYIELTYMLPGGFTDPACGWEIEWSPVGYSTSSKIPYAHLPTSGIIKIPTQNMNGVLRVRALQCDGKEKECHVNDIIAITPPPCQPITNKNMQIVEEQQPDGTCLYYLEITFTQSIPATTTPILSYSQFGNASIAPDHYYKKLSISPTATKIKHKLRPSLAEGQESMEYHVSLTDACANSGLPTKIIFVRTQCFHELIHDHNDD